MANVVWLFRTNRLQASDVVITPSSEQTGLGRDALLRQGIDDRLYFRGQFTVRTDENNTLDFNRGGAKVAVCAEGTYTSGTAYAAAWQAAFIAADGATPWSVTYDVSTHRIIISAGGVAFSLLLATGVNPETSAGPDLGFDAVDWTGVTIAVAQRATYQTRHFLNIDLRVVEGESSVVITPGVNDKLDVQTSTGVHVATIPGGTYTDPDAFSLVVQAALGVAEPTYAWTITYDPSGLRFSALTAFGQPFSFLFLTGANFATSVHPQLGWADADTVYFTFTEADKESFNTAWPSFSNVIVKGHNFSNLATVRFDCGITSLIATGITVPPVTTFNLTGDERAWSASFAQQTFRFVRLVIDDTQNPTGFNSLGVLWIGSPDLPEELQRPGFVKTYEPLAQTMIALRGANSINRKPNRIVYRMRWKIFSAASLTIFEELVEAHPPGENFFITFDAIGDPNGVVYGFIRGGLQIDYQRGVLEYVGLEFATVLG